MRRYKPVYFLITVLLSLAIFFMIATNLDNSENSVQTHSLKLPGLEISNEDSGLSKWMLPALMLDDDLSSEFIENNVYISAFRIVAFEGSAKTTFLSFTVSYSIDDERMTKSYRIEVTD